MVLRGETLATEAASTCPDCGVTVQPKVCSSAAGYYVGTWCDCGPYSRESGYYRTEEQARTALDTEDYWR